MKNRYLLLSITLITGLATEIAQASDSLKELKELASLPVVYKAIENALPKDLTVAKVAAAVYAPPARLTQREQRRKSTYETVHSYLTQYNIKLEYANWYLKTAENLMLAEGQKYDPDFGSRFKSWGLSDGWGVSTEGTTNRYNMPDYCIRDIIAVEPRMDSANRSSFHHERGHDYLDHLQEADILLERMSQKKNFARFYLAETKREFLQISNKKELLEDLASYHYLCVEQEKEADAFVPEDPTLLAARTKYYAFRAQNVTQFYHSHPSDKQRAEYFRNRFKRVTKLQTEAELDNSIASYANDFHLTTDYSDSNASAKQSFLFPDEYSVYLAIKPAVLTQLPFETLWEEQK